MKWPKEKIDISLIRRWIGNEEDGIMDVYQLFMTLIIGKKRYDWALYITLNKIRDLQKYVNMGIAACYKVIDKGIYRKITGEMAKRT